VINQAFSNPSLTNESIAENTNPSHALLFYPNLSWYNNIPRIPLPPSVLVSSTKSIALLIADATRESYCASLNNTSFGNLRNIPQLIYPWALGTFYLFSNVSLAASLTDAPQPDNRSLPNKLHLAPPPGTIDDLYPENLVQ